MPLRPQLMAQIQAVLGPAMVPSLTVASAGFDLFEGVILSLTLRAAAAEGAAITFENVGGTGTNAFTFVTNTVAPSVERLLSHKKKRWDHQIVPAFPNDVTRLQNVFQDTFKIFKARF